MVELEEIISDVKSIYGCVELKKTAKSRMLSFNNEDENQPPLPEGNLPSQMDPAKPRNNIAFEFPSKKNAFKLKRTTIHSGANVYNINRRPNLLNLQFDPYEEAMAEEFLPRESSRIFSLEEIPSLGEGTHICTYIFYEKDGVTNIHLIKVFSALEFSSLHNTLVYMIHPTKLLAAGEMEITIAGGSVSQIRFNFASGTYMKKYEDYLKNFNKKHASTFQTNILEQKKKSIHEFVQSKGFPKPTFVPMSQIETFIPKDWLNVDELQRLKTNYGLPVKIYSKTNYNRAHNLNTQISSKKVQIKAKKQEIGALEVQKEKANEEGKQKSIATFEGWINASEKELAKFEGEVKQLLSEQKTIQNRTQMLGGKKTRKEKRIKNKKTRKH
jgi:hypothetical protein